MFLNMQNKQSSGGVYAVQIYALGMPMTVMVDDFLPMFQQPDGEFSTLYSNLGHDVPIWGAILEKAFAKRYGNYEHVTEGVPSEAIRALTGAPLIAYEHKDYSAAALWQIISNNDPSDDFMVVGTETMSVDSPSDIPGVAPGHTYTILGTHVLKRNGEKLVKIRNPWGHEGFHGTWAG